MTETGIITIRVQKSGCNHTNNNTAPIIIENGINQSLKVCKTFLYLAKNEAKYIISENFRNSVGCRVNGKPGIFIHHLAHFKVRPDINTIISNIRLTIKKYFEYLLKKV
jgi:hypothetical protein